MPKPWDCVHNPTIVGFSFSSPTSPWWEVLNIETPLYFVAYLANVDVNTLLQRGYCLVGLLDAQWGRSAQKSNIFVHRNRLNTENPTSAHNTQQQEDTMLGDVRHQPLPPPMALRRPSRSNVPAYHIPGNIRYVPFVIFCIGG